MAGSSSQHGAALAEAQAAETAHKPVQVEAMEVSMVQTVPTEELPSEEQDLKIL